ncbi:hypothetical protein [Bradyrhizobium sp. S69]|nr:hypothetical protein [Bradyrhizobium sp. S69]
MTAQQRKTTTKAAERLNGENGKAVSDLPLFTNDDSAKGNSLFAAAFFGG